jgi:transposase-like protein
LTKHGKCGQKRGLSIEQQNAIDLLVQGLTDREVAEVVGVARQTITTWRNRHKRFAQALEERRRELWSSQLQRLRALVRRAVDILEQSLGSVDERVRIQCAVHILRAVGLYQRGFAEQGEDTEGRSVIVDFKPPEQRQVIISLKPPEDEEEEPKERNYGGQSV